MEWILTTKLMYLVIIFVILLTLYLISRVIGLFLGRCWLSCNVGDDYRCKHCGKRYQSEFPGS